MLPQTIGDYILPPPAIAGDYDFTSARSSNEELRHLAESAAKLATFREALSAQSDALENLYRDIEQGAASAAELEGAAGFILEGEKSAASALVPAIEKLEETLATNYPSSHFIFSLRRLAEDGLDAARTWLEIFQNLRIRLLRLASERRGAAGETGSAVLSDAREMESYLRRIIAE